MCPKLRQCTKIGMEKEALLRRTELLVWLVDSRCEKKFSQQPIHPSIHPSIHPPIHAPSAYPWSSLGDDTQVGHV
jgi:hypothetical protein